MMKFFSIIGFLFLAVVNTGIYSKTNTAIIDQAKTGGRRSIKITALRFISFFIVFIQYWVLTGLFPIYLILLLLAASSLGLIINTLMGAISGFTLKENQKKISALSAIWGVSQNKATACTIMAASLISVFGGAILSLWVFWKYPKGDPKAIVLIALFHFVVPQIIRIPLMLSIMWPTVTSEYLDDDLRNSYLADSFSNIIYQTIFLLFPLWLFKQEITQFQWALPPFWVLLSIPLFAFIGGGLLPFFVGLYRYRAQTRSMYEWKAEWLKDVSDINTMPAGDARENAFKDKLAELTEEIKLRFSENDLFTFYQNLRIEDGTAAVDVTPLPVNQQAVEVLPAAEEATAALVKTPMIDPVKLAKQYLKGQIPPQPTADDFNQSLMSIVRENYANLVHWDIRFAYLQDLLQLYEVTIEGMTKDISKFVEARLKAVKESLAARTPKKNILAGSVLSLSSSGIIWLFKHYEPAISGLIDKLVR